MCWNCDLKFVFVADWGCLMVSFVSVFALLIGVCAVGFPFRMMMFVLGLDLRILFVVFV